ncbi:hypothetical protein ACIBMX_10860 [Streptomyces phaeochromogenes]|uniref:hypothetical protein n=1 Tax=Streptomyces phaeochromogenes TaxID=1923 RepID=UPI003401862B
MNEFGGYDELLSLLTGPADFWDRPAGDWPARSSGVVDVQRDVGEARQDANAAYLLGTKALRRNDLDSAEAWFAVACDQQHPGAAFRAALTRLLAMAPPKIVLSGQVGSGKSHALAARMVAQMGNGKTHKLLRPVGSGRGRVIALLTAAARWGHGDAQRLIGRLRSGAGECVAYLVWPVGELAAVVDDDDLAGTVLMADTVPYEPQDTEFYPTVQVLLEQCFALHHPAPHALLHSEQPGGAEHQTLTSAHRLVDADSGQELCTSGELFGAEHWSARWRSLADDGLGHGSLRRPDSHERRLALGLADDAGAQLVLPDFPIVLWARSCREGASTPWVHAVSQRRCSRCTNELAPFTDVLIEALGTDQQSQSTLLPKFVKTLRRIRRAQETLQRPERAELGSHLALLFDDPRDLATEAPVAVRAQHSRSSPGHITGFTHRTFQEYLHGSMDSPPSPGGEGFVARRARWHKLYDGAREQGAADRALVLAAAMYDGIDNRHAEQLATSVFVSIKELAIGFDLPRPSSLHVVCDKAQRLYFFTDPHGVAGNPEEPQLAVPTVVTNPLDNPEAADQPITTTPSPSSGRSDLRELNCADPLQVYAMDA